MVIEAIEDGQLTLRDDDRRLTLRWYGLGLEHFTAGETVEVRREGFWQVVSGRKAVILAFDRNGLTPPERLTFALNEDRTLGLSFTKVCSSPSTHPWSCDDPPDSFDVYGVRVDFGSDEPASAPIVPGASETFGRTTVQVSHAIGQAAFGYPVDPSDEIACIGESEFDAAVTVVHVF